MGTVPARTGFAASLRPRVVRPQNGRVHTIKLPGIGRVAVSRDMGEAALFGTQVFSTKLRAVVRDPVGRLVEERDLGSGLVTNVGALALAVDFGVPGVSGAAANLFANLKYHAWGTGVTAAAVTDIKLQTLAAPNATTATTGVNSLTANGEGKPKLVSTAKITAAGSLAITEWGIHTASTLSATTGTPLTAETAISGTVTGTPLTASSATALGETLKILVAAESEEIWGLITSNTTSVVTVPAWYKASSGAVKAPTTTSSFTIKPVMFDHRVFPVINVESGNSIEFPWELEIKSGG